MASKETGKSNVTGEILVAWQNYSAILPDELDLAEGDAVELLNTEDASSSPKRLKLDPDLDKVSGELLDNTAARHKLSVKPKRTHVSSRHSPTRLSINQRWLVRQIKGEKKQGWVPCRILQTADDPSFNTSGLPGDAEFRRLAVVKELIETEQEFVRDLDHVVERYLIPSESGKVPKIVKDNFDVIFGNLKEIAEFHRIVLIEGVKYQAKNPVMIGKTFLRLERDFDKHVAYCSNEPVAQEMLDSCDEIYDYFAELSHKFGDDKSISEHLKLPIQRINDYQLLIKELVRYTSCLGENDSDLRRALDLMLSVPHRAQDDKFVSSIEGYKGNVHKLGRLLAHDRFTVTFENVSKERYLFLFKARILICKVRRISEDRSIFQLKDCVRLPQIQVKDHPEEPHTFELVDKVGKQSLILKLHRNVKDFWLKEIREFAKDHSEVEDISSDEFQKDSSLVESKESESKETKKPIQAPKKLSQLVKAGTTTDNLQKSDPVEPEKPKPKIDIITEKPRQAPRQPIRAPEVTEPAELKSVESLGTFKPPGKSQQQDKLVKELKLVLTEQSSSSESTLVAEAASAVAFTTTTNTTTTDLPPSESETLKQVQTPESEEPVEDHHLRRIQAVEPLIQINKPRVLEEVIPYIIKPPPELVPGSAVDKLFSVEKQGVSDVVLTDFKVGIEVNVEVEDEMSRRYASSRSEGGQESSAYSRSSYSSDNRSSSRYATGTSSKYNTEGGSKYDDLSSKYSKKSYNIDGGDSSALTSSYTSRRAVSSADDDYGYSRKSRVGSSDADSDSLTYSRRLSKPADVEGDGYSSYSRKSSRSVTRTDGSGNAEDYSYTRRGIKTTLEGVGDGDQFTIRKTLRTSVEGTGIEPSETNDAYSYSSKLGSRHSIRSVSIDEAKDDTEDILSRYSRKYSRNNSAEPKAIGEKEEDKYAKYTRKYSRTDSHKDEDDTRSSRRSFKAGSRTEEEGNVRSRRISRETSNDEEDAYEKYARKYLRKETTSAEGRDKVQDVESVKYLRSDSSRSKNSEDESSSVKISSQVEIGEQVATSERVSSKTFKSESLMQESAATVSATVEENVVQKSITESSEASISKKEVTQKRYINGNQETMRSQQEDGLSISLRSVREKSAEDKLEELKEDGVLKFTKTIRGTSIEPGDTAHFEVSLSESPSSFAWLKDNKPVDADEDLTGRIRESRSGRDCAISIRQVREEDAGIYTAVAQTGEEKATCSAQLVVHGLTAEERATRSSTDKPEFMVSMKDAELLEDTYLRFMVKIAGEPNPEVAFFKDGSKIVESDKRYRIIKEHSDKGFYELVIPEVKKSDAGIYKCVATNKFGESSSEASVTVTENKHVFDDMPEGEILPPGEKPVFHWKKDGAPFEPEERFKVLMGDDEDSLALVFQKVRPDDVGLYTCVAQTSRGHISCSAELTVHGTVNQLFREPMKPTLVVIKKDPIVNVGGSAMLELQVKGYPKPNIKFMHEGRSIEASTKHKILYEDEESVSLVIKDVESSDAGKYTFTAENELGVDSVEMNLTVKAPPKIKTKMDDISAHADLLLKMEVEVEGIPKPTIQFYKNGKVIKQSESTKIVESGDKHSLVIQKTSLKDSGSYSVVASNELAQVSQFWNLDVHTKPKVMQKLGADRTVSQGQNVELKVKLESEPKAVVKWFKDEQEIKSSEHFIIKEDGNSYILKITGAVTTDAAKYKCRAVNIHGSVDDEVTINVKKPPKIIQGLQDMTVTEHDKNVTLDVKLEAFPKPTVKWYLDEMEVQETRTEFTRIEYDDGVKLVIKEVSSELSGQYTCKLSNECGGAETSAKLTVNCAPRFVKQLKDTTVEEGATLHLEVEVEGCPAPTVKWLRNGREVSADARIRISRDKQRHETFNLAVDLIKYEEQGEYEVIVTNCLGTVSCKSFVTVHKVIHSDAIEETEEPTKQVVVDVVEDVPKKAEKDDKKEKIECEPETAKKVEIEEVEEPKKAGGPNYQKLEVDLKESTLKSQEPIIEEPESPVAYKRKTSAIIEEADTEEIEPVSSRKHVEETTLPNTKGKSIEIEEISEHPTNSTPIEKIGSNKRVPEKAFTACEEDVIQVISTERAGAKSIEVTDIDSNRILQRAESATKQEIKINEESLNTSPLKPVETEVDSSEKSTKTARQATIETAELHENDDFKAPAKKFREVQVKIQESQKGGKEYVDDKDDRTEKLLKKAQKQRSLVEDVPLKQSEASEALPIILDTNMKDGSRPESLEVTYIVRGFANPPPVATWTLNDKEIKPDGHLRMTTSQNGEEFKLEITKLEMKDAGVYQCVLSNPLGDVKHQAVLEVTPEKDLRRPKLKEGLKNQTIVKKSSVTFKAVIVGDPVPDVAWYCNGTEMLDEEFEKNKMILETEDHEIEDGLNECTYSLTIPRCDADNSGIYTIKARNRWGECESSAHLTIVMRPEIEGPEDVTVVPGDAAEFKVVVRANPEPLVVWTKNGVTLETGAAVDVVEDKASRTYKLVFRDVKLSDEGYYKVTATNEQGESSSEARMKTIKEAEPTTERPKFITGLADDQIEHKRETTLMVRADGLPKPEIRWTLNGKLIVEDDDHKIETIVDAQVTSKLKISNFHELDSGIYKAIAVNVVGDAETSSRVTMLQIPPSFGKKLDRNADVNEGEPVELKAKINGSPRPTVSWFKNGEPLTEDDANIKTTVLPDGTVKLNIEKCKPSDSGAYKLIVKNANGETACLCAVAVTQKPKRPKFLKCFKDVRVPTGAPLRLDATVEAHPPPEIKWLKDGVPVRASSNVRCERHPDGRVALVVDAATPESAGVYRLVAANRLGEAVAEASAAVERRPTKPEFVGGLQPQTVVEGFPVKFEVRAEGFPTPTITWSRNGAEVVSDNKHIRIVDQPDGSSALLLDSADRMRDALTYRATAANEAGEAETSAPLTVKDATKPGEPEERPMFLHAIKDVLVDEGQQLIIEAPFTGNPIPSAEWKKDGLPITPSDRILMTCDGRRVGIKIDKATLADAGVYEVRIVSPMGEDKAEGRAKVKKVFMSPTFTQKFTDLQQLPERDAKFPCRVTGVPQPEVAWTNNGVPLRETDKYHIKRDGDLCCLYVLNCEEGDAGVYRATAINQEGQDNCTATLEVVREIKAAKKIEPPVFLKRIGDTELFKAMTAKFTACASGIPEPTVEWFHDDKKLFPSTRIKMDKDTNGLLRLTIAGVDEDDLGRYSCKLSNEHGTDICHATLKFDEGLEPKAKRPITDQYADFDKYKRSGAPMPISDPPIISQMTDRHCTLSWKPSIPGGPRAPVTYQLEMCELPLGDWFTVRSGVRSCTCGVRNLEPFRDYRFRVRVENKYGISDPSPYAVTHREKLEVELPKFRPHLPPEIDFRPETSPYFPKDFDIERPPHDGMAQAPRFLRQEHDVQYGVKDQSTSLFWFVYGYPKPKMSFYFDDELVDSNGGRFDSSYTRNGQATLFINKMLERDVGWYEAVAKNEHGEARQRVRLEIAELPYFLRRPEIDYVMLRGKAKFEARIVGVPYPEIKWYKDWKPLAASTRIKIAFIEPDITVLTINDVILKDEGLYSVSARNVAGSASSSAMLHVEENEHEYKLRNYSNLSPLKSKRKAYTDFYDIGDELGRGTQGVTYHAVERLNGRNYAAKVMHGKGDLRPFMYNELDMLNELRHRKLVSLHDSYDTDDSLTLILELASGGNLVQDHLLKSDYYTESDIAGFVRQMLQGLDYMHDRGYGHMGLNLGDLLLSHPGGDDLKITDFSLTRRIQAGSHYPLKYGVPEYVSPEAVNGDGVGFGHDMWSVGVITYILLSGRSPFRGDNDRETLNNIKSGKWIFEESWWSNISIEARDFISRLLVYDTEARMDVRTSLRHSWLERADKRYSDEYRISSSYLTDYWRLYREWYDNASSRRWFRRRPLEGAFTHPSKMVYPPGDYDSPRATPAPLDKTPRTKSTWEDQLPTRSPLNYEIGVFKSESHYQNGPDTYLLQLRDVDFPVRLREYMKVAGNRGPGSGYILSNENGYDWRTPIIHERRRFTDVMDEEIDDERKARINRYGAADRDPAVRRIRHELGSRLDTYVEAEAFLEAKQEGRLPFFREKSHLTAMQEGKDLELTCLAVGDPQPIVQWFKNDAIIAESHRIKITTDEEGRSHFKLMPALSFDQGLYKVVARNKIGQTIARTRIVLGLVPDEPDSPEASQMSDSEILLTWKQPKFDGNAPVICYRLEYKMTDESEWIKKADNIDHEFYLISGLDSNKSYIFRLAAKNSIGWSDSGVPSAPIMTKPSGTPKIKLSSAMLHLQQITDSGKLAEEETNIQYDYSLETKPIEWEESDVQENFSFISEIARGRFSLVLKAVDKKKDTVVVAKILEYNDGRREDVDGEFAALRSLRHERVAGLLSAYRLNDTAVFVLEKLQGADILTYLSNKHEYSEQTVATIVSQILDGLQYLHWRGLCHLDLQPDNAVMCGVRSVQVKLVDLGSAHRVTKLGTKVPVLGHPDYIAPEVLAEEPAFPQSDIWSVGVLTYIMLSGIVPFRGQDENESRQNILFVRYRFEHLFQEVSQEATRFLMLLFKRHPNKRPSPEECHENRWLLPTDYMIKKRERAVFLGHRLKDYADEYHSERDQLSQKSKSLLGIKVIRSQSIEEELLTAP